MSGHKSFKVLSHPIDTEPERRARVEELERTYDDVLALADLRESLGITQARLAESLGVSQPNVSKVERKKDIHLSTLIDYVAALGGNLELKAVFPNQTVDLSLPREGQQQTSQNQQSPSETLSEEAIIAYVEFLNPALSFYKEAMIKATQEAQAAQDNVQQAAEATQQDWMEAVLAAQEAVLARQQAMENAIESGPQGAEEASQAAQEAARGDEQADNQTTRNR